MEAEGTINGSNKNILNSMDIDAAHKITIRYERNSRPKLLFDFEEVVCLPMGNIEINY